MVRTSSDPHDRTDRDLVSLAKTTRQRSHLQADVRDPQCPLTRRSPADSSVWSCPSTASWRPTSPRAPSTRVVERSHVGAGDRIADIGPGTRAAYAKEIAGAGTIVWNGPMAFSSRRLRRGYHRRSRARSPRRATAAPRPCSVAGTPPRPSSVRGWRIVSRTSPTGGGASLEFLAGQSARRRRAR